MAWINLQDCSELGDCLIIPAFGLESYAALKALLDTPYGTPLPACGVPSTYRPWGLTK